MQIDREAARARPSGNLTIFVCDIVGFGERAGRDRVQEHLRATLYAALKNAFDDSGMRYEDCYREDRGDGVMIILPAEADSALLVHPLIDRLRGEIRRANELASEPATMRLRVALHCGRLTSDANGVVGTTVNHAFRLLDAPGFKQAMRESTAVVGVLASAEFYAAVIENGPGAIDPSEYGPIDVRVKETETTAWIRIPGTPASPPGADVVSKDEPLAERTGRLRSEDRSEDQNEDRREADSVPDLFEVVDRILDIPIMATTEGRDQAVSSLPREIAIRIPRRAQPHLDMYSIIHTCLDFDGGIERFLALVRVYAGDSIQMKALDETIARIRRQG